MPQPTALAPAMQARVRADQVAQLFGLWHRTSLSMAFGGTLLCFVLWGQVSPWWMAAWAGLIAANQAWRGLLARAWRQQQPGQDATLRWGRYWTVGTFLAGALWGLAAIVLYPSSPPHQALLIVCMFGAVLGGLNRTAVYKPAFYAFVLPALVPLIVRVALEGDQVHLYTALVMSVVLGFVLTFGHQLNDVLTRSLAMRYENLDLIAELKDQSRAAHEARAAAEGANHAKSRLLAAASHDLRQPLHALGLYIAALAARATDAEWQPLVGCVQRSLAALESQFEQLLDLSRLESGVLTPSPTRVPLAPLLTKVAGEFAVQTAAKGFTLKVMPTRLAVRSDAALLERIVRNLVANAVRYTERGGVAVGVRRRGRDVAIDVVDTGIGIPAAHRERIFEEFFQVHGSRSSRALAGMGLGLAIVRRLVALLDHRVEVTSTPGRGSRFRVIAPRAARTPSSQAASWPRQTRAPRAVGGVALNGALVAVIDDDLAAIDAMTALFATWGASVAGGADAAALLDALGRLERYPDLIVTDLRLADGGNGVDALRQLHDELGYAAPALVVSGDTSATAEREVRSAGFTLLPKPVVPSVLCAVATTLIAESLSSMHKEMPARIATTALATRPAEGGAL